MTHPSRVLAILFASALAMPHMAQATDFLDPNQAFKVGAKAQATGSVELFFDIRPGHYMYREKFAVRTESGEELSLQGLPPGERKFDEAFQREMEVHRGLVRVAVQLAPAATALQVTGQGCADKGLCYAPMTSTLRMRPDGRWTLEPGSDPAGEFGAATLDAPTAATSGWGLWASVCAGLFGLLLLSRKF